MMGSIVKDGMVYSLTQGLGLDPLCCQKRFSLNIYNKYGIYSLILYFF